MNVAKKANVEAKEPQVVVERVHVDELKLDPKNARKHPDRNLAAIRASLERFGQQKPIVVKKDGTVIAGNGTLEAARVLGWTHLDVVRTELDGADAAAFAIADNRTGELSEWDITALAEAMESVGSDLASDLGWNAEDIVNAALDTDDDSGLMAATDGRYKEQYGVIVICETEAEQKTVYEKLMAEGMNCKVVVT